MIKRVYVKPALTKATMTLQAVVSAMSGLIEL
ncbi:hypothetical protein DFR52_102833 [Hoeflea marina]|uniref:Uncharacterized protein n=1 Tax=Hoeflea marina TaxID=274592 RepID=A0A317PMJ5_9HYPH|nr:hypothetical protein DFR52_102833 [Hoeflea marina]